MTWKMLVGLWFAFGAVGAVVGFFSSFFTGHAEELPAWRGFDYAAFCSVLGFMSAMLLSVIPVLIFAWYKIRRDA